MTPQERQLVTDLFDRLASLENQPRDPEAERLVADGLRRAPHAVYALVQTALVQDEALKHADARIKELEGGEAPQQGGGFLDSMRDALLGRDARSQASVPQIRSSSVWNTQGGSAQADYAGQPQGYGPAGQGSGAIGGMGQPMVGHGGSFLGTAAAAAAGVIGGSLLMSSFRNMFPGSQQAQSAFDQGGGASPWSGGSAADSDLARQAGLDDVGASRRDASGDSSDRQGLFGGNDNDVDGDGDYADDSDGGFDDTSDA